MENMEKYFTTWTIHGGNIGRQIDYMMANAKYRSTVRKAHNNICWHANMHQNQQHRVQTMQLYYNASKKYKNPIPAETGRNLKYDVKDLRKHPEKLTEAYQKQQQEIGRTEQPGHNWREWEEYQMALGKLLFKTYPLKKKDAKAQEPEWTSRLDEWGAEKEKDDLTYTYKEREILCKKR